MRVNYRFWQKTLVCICIVITLVLSSCGTKDNQDKGSADSKTDQVKDGDYVSEVTDAVSAFLEESGSPLYMVMKHLVNGAETGYSVNMTETENAFDKKDLVTNSVIASDPDIGMSVSTETSYQNTAPVKFDWFIGKEELAFSNSELYGDTVYGLTYDGLYDGFNKTVFSPNSSNSVRFSEMGLSDGVYPFVASIGEYDIAGQHELLSAVEDLFFEYAEGSMTNSEITVNDSAANGNVITFVLTGENYKQFYTDLADLCSTNNVVRNYVVNSSYMSNTGVVDSFLFDDLANDGYSYYVKSLREKGSKGVKDGSEISISVCLKDDKLVGLSFKNNEKSFPCEYSFAKTESGDIAYYLHKSYSGSGYACEVIEESGVISITNNDTEYRVEYSYDAIGYVKDKKVSVVENETGSFIWNKNTGEYKFVYFPLAIKQTREGKLIINDDGFELESYCRKYNTDDGSSDYGYAVDTPLVDFNDLKLTFKVGEVTVDKPEYTDVLKMDSDTASDFIDTTINNFAESFKNDSWVHLWACSDKYFIPNFDMDKIPVTSDLGKLNIGMKFMYSEVLECFEIYRYKEEQEVLGQLLNSCQFIENGKYYCISPGISKITPYEELANEEYLDEYYIITFNNFEATIEFVGY